MKHDDGLTGVTGVTATALPTILVIGRDGDSRSNAVRVLDEAGYSTHAGETAQQTLDCLREHPVDILIIDIRVGMNEEAQLLQQAKTLNPDLQVILLTPEEVSKTRLLHTVQEILDVQSVHREGGAVRLNVKKSIGETFVYRSIEMRKIARMVEQAAVSTATVLITGESGTGKEVLADRIHAASSRASSPLIKVNCAALPESLIEAELFGNEKGAFTGAHASKEGRFELAHGGTVFLDEIGDISPGTQLKLLRVLQNRTFERVGGTRTIQADVRIIAATNKDLHSEVEAGRFREDLFYRLNVINITVPPLRERRSDIELLAAHFVRVFAQRNGKQLRGITEDAMSALLAYTWPGNIRELENAMERAVVLATGKFVTLGSLPSGVSAPMNSPPLLSFTIGASLRDIQDRAIELTLHYARGDKHRAAQMLGVAPRTIYRHLKRHE